MSDPRVLTAPEAFTVTRWRCPHCQRTHSSKYRAQDHIARCWYNPAARSCKTCIHYIPASGSELDGGNDEECTAGIDLRSAAEDNNGHRTLPLNCQKWDAPIRAGLPDRVPCQFCGGQSRWMWSAWNEDTREFVPVHPDCWHLVKPPGSGGVVEHAPDNYAPPEVTTTEHEGGA